MFFIVRKDKIISYMVSVCTVIILMVMAFSISKSQEVIETAASIKKLPIYNVQTDENKVALTMNCAWNADDIDSILQTLEKHNVHITFFMVGDWVDKYADTVKKIADKGHEIGNHSNTHPHVNQLSLEKNIAEIEGTAKKIKKITGKATTLYRGPYGEYNDTVIQAAEAQNHYTIQWNIDTLDYSGLTGEEMWSRIENKLEKGSIILMHNGTKHTADSLDSILSKIKQKGFKIVTVSDLIYKENYKINVNGTQMKNSE